MITIDNYAALPYEAALRATPRTSVRLLLCPVPTVNSKTEQHTTNGLTLPGVYHVSVNWQSNLEVKILKEKVTGAEM